MNSPYYYYTMRYKTRVQVVAVIDMLVGTFPFIDLAFAFNDKSLAEIQDREYLVLAWMTILCVYVLQFIMGIWLLAATRECYSEYTVGNCQVWYYIAMFTFVFYIGEMGYAISVIMKAPPRDQTVKKVILTMLFHATKIIYRAVTLMTVNNFLYDICRPVYKYLSQGSYMYTSYYNYRLGIPPPRRRRRLSSVTTQLMIPVKTQPRMTSSTTQDQPTGPPATTEAALGSYIASPPIIVPSTPAPPASAAICPPPSTNTANRPAPMYNPTKVPLQPIPNYNFYFTYPQPKPKKQCRTQYDTSATNNHPNYYYTTINSMKQPP